MLEILFPCFVVLLLLGVPIAVSLGAASLLAITLGSNISLVILPQKLMNGINGFPFMAIPLFLFAGNVMAEAKISEKLIALAALMVGKLPGGLAHVSTGASALFGAISGSAPATTAAIGGVMIPTMVQRGYKPEYAAAVVAASGALGLIIPPSLSMVIYGVLSGTSIGSLFMCGILPGILIATTLILFNYILAKRSGFVDTGNKTDKTPWEIVRESGLALIMPIIIMGGIYSGMFTPTESAGVACLYGVIVGVFIYRNLTFKSIGKLLMDTAESSAMVLFLMGMANLFSYIITAEQVPQLVERFILGFTSNPKVVMLLILALLLIVGTFLDNVAALVLLVPTLMNIVQAVNIDPIYFGVFTIIALAVGQFTPPVGLNLFVAAGIAKQRLEPVAYQCLPYILAYVSMLLLFIAVPWLLMALKYTS